MLTATPRRHYNFLTLWWITWGGAYGGAYGGAGGGLPGAGSGLPLQAEATLWGGVALGRSGIGTSVGPPSYTAGVWPSPPGFATMRHRPPPPPPPKIDESAQTQGVMMCAPRQASPELRPSEPTPHPPNHTLSHPCQAASTPNLANFRFLKCTIYKAIA